MTKDRMLEMIRLMRDNNISIEQPEPMPEEMSQSIKAFLEQVQCCRNEIQNIRDEIRTVKNYHNQIQRSTNETTRKDLECKVEEKKTLITTSITALRNNLKTIQDFFCKQKVSPALQRMKDVQINSLVQMLNELTQDYYISLVDHFEKCKQLLYHMISITSEDKSDFEDLLEKGKIAFFTNNLLLNELEEKVHFRNLEDTHADILNIEKSVLELKNLTQDLSLLISVHEEKVEYVEQYVEKTAKKVENAAKIMKTATKRRNKMRKRKLIIAILCLGIIIITLSIIIFI